LVLRINQKGVNHKDMGADRLRAELMLDLKTVGGFSAPGDEVVGVIAGRVGGVFDPRPRTRVHEKDADDLIGAVCDKNETGKATRENTAEGVGVQGVLRKTWGINFGSDVLSCFKLQCFFNGVDGSEKADAGVDLKGCFNKRGITG